MAIIKCKMCGGDIELSADKTFGSCEYCGSTMTFPRVDDDQRAAAFNRGNQFRRIGEFDKALAVYERIVREDDTDAEAHWCCALCRFGIEYVEDPATYEWLPTCHRASFDAFLEDVDYRAAVENSDGITRRQYMKDATKIAEVQRGILATSQNTEPYDVFICYKESDESGNRTRDSLMAQDIYYQLTEQGRKVFFARITLEDVAGTRFEPYIFAALNSAKVMIVVGTRPEHLSAVWVKNEWSRFLAMMKKDRHKLLLPCYRDMDPYDMPEQLAVLQSYDMSRIGFIQDLTRGVAKVLDAEKKPEPVKENVVVPQSGGGNMSALLKRGNMALEDGEWDKADQFYEDVLNQDAECAEAYLGKLMAALHVHRPDELAKTPRTFVGDIAYQRALRFSTGRQAEILRGYCEENGKFLLKQGEQALRDGNFSEADDSFNEALQVNPDWAEAYLGKFLAEQRGCSLEQVFGEMWQKLQEDAEPEIILVTELGENRTAWIQQARKEYVVTGNMPGRVVEEAYPKTAEYASARRYWQEQQEAAAQYLENREYLRKAHGLADAALRGEIDSYLERLRENIGEQLAQAEDHDTRMDQTILESCLRQAEQYIARWREKEEAYLLRRYRELCAAQETTTDIWRLTSLSNDFLVLGDYRDCQERAQQIREKRKAIEQEKKEQQARNQQAARWMSEGKCAHCGGELRGLFTKKCVNCGKVTDY